MKQRTIVFIAPPGSGKGTQAEKLVEKFGFYHLETSKLLEKQLVHSVSQDPAILEAQRLYHARQLITPSLVARIVMSEIEKLYGEGRSIVFSGSFRTIEEATQEIPLVEKLFGRENVQFFHITLGEEESIRRNTNRRICQAQRHPIPNFPEYRDVAVCPFGDESPLVVRSLDGGAEQVRERYQVYLRDTQPVLDFIRSRDYHIIVINGEQSIEDVSSDILKHFRP